MESKIVCNYTAIDCEANASGFVLQKITKNGRKKNKSREKILLASSPIELLSKNTSQGCGGKLLVNCASLIVSVRSGSWGRLLRGQFVEKVASRDFKVMRSCGREKLVGIGRKCGESPVWSQRSWMKMYRIGRSVKFEIKTKDSIIFIRETKKTDSNLKKRF
jgi:hypothetical protein